MDQLELNLGAVIVSTCQACGQQMRKKSVHEEHTCPPGVYEALGASIGEVDQSSIVCP